MTIERSNPLLVAMCAATVGFGVVAALAAHPVGEVPWRALFDLLRAPIDGVATTFDTTGRVLNAILGGVMFGWGVMLTRLLVWPAPSVRHAVREGLVAWWVVDCTGSVVAGLPTNVILNTVFALGFLAALRAPRSASHDGGAAHAPRIA